MRSRFATACEGTDWRRERKVRVLRIYRNRPRTEVRLSVANNEESGGTLSLSFSFYLAHGSNASSSVPLYESEWIKVPQREFRFSDVSRKDLNSEGEPETGRAQMMVRVTIIAPAGSNADDFPASLEIIEEEVQGGETVQTDSK